MMMTKHSKPHSLSYSDLKLIGTVTSGLGEGTYFTQLDWVIDFFQTHLGFVPYQGTFNLQMQGKAWVQGRNQLLHGSGIEVPPRQGSCRAKCFLVRLTGCVSGVVVFPAVGDYPLNKLEVVAPVNVRQALEVKDGDRLKVLIDMASDTPLATVIDTCFRS